jgi:hypothetical protein
MERGCLTAVGAIVALVSAFFVVAAVVESLSGGDGKTSAGVYAGLIVFFGGLMVGGAYLVWRMVTKQRVSQSGAGTGDPAPAPPTGAERERKVLRFAEKEHGRVTIPEVAASCDMTIEESKRELDRLVTLQAAIIQVTSAGVLVYVFPGFLSDEDKARADDF